MPNTDKELTVEQIAAVREFTYYPIMAPEDCWFRVESKKHSHTYHRCERHGRVKIDVYPFCERHAKIVNEAIGSLNND